MGKKRLPIKTANMNTRVTEHVLKRVERIVYTEGYADISDYVRNLIRKDFKERGIIFKMEERPLEEKAEA